MDERNRQAPGERWACVRQEFESRLAAETARVNRYGGVISLIVLDIDNFPELERRLGTSFGEQLTGIVAAMLRKNIRAADHLGHWDGMKFAVMAPHMSLGEATGIAVKLRHLLEDYLFAEAGHLTASFGVAEYRPGERPEQLVDRTEAALECARSAGGNRIATERSSPCASAH